MDMLISDVWRFGMRWVMRLILSSGSHWAGWELRWSPKLVRRSSYMGKRYQKSIGLGVGVFAGVLYSIENRNPRRHSSMLRGQRFGFYGREEAREKYEEDAEGPLRPRVVNDNSTV